MIKERLIGYIEQSIRQNWEIEALSNYKEKGYSYKEIAEKILRLHIIFRGSRAQRGGKSSPYWPELCKLVHHLPCNCYLWCRYCSCSSGFQTGGSYQYYQPF